MMLHEDDMNYAVDINDDVSYEARLKQNPDIYIICDKSTYLAISINMLVRGLLWLANAQWWC